jgi:hypothetical protein
LEQCFVTNLFLAVLTQRLKILSSVEILAVLRGAVQKWCHPLEARAFGKWSMHWQAGQQALEMTILSKLDATKMDVYAAVVERMGFERGVLLGRSKPKAFRRWKGLAQESKATKLAELRQVQLQKELSQQQEAAGIKKVDSAFTTCSNHLYLLKYQVYTSIKNLVLSNGLEHAVIQGVIVSTIIQAMEHDPGSTFFFLPPAVRPVALSPSFVSHDSPLLTIPFPQLPCHHQACSPPRNDECMTHPRM